MKDLGKGVLLKRFGHEGYGFQARYPPTLMPKLFDGIKFEFVRGKCVVFVILLPGSSCGPFCRSSWPTAMVAREACSILVSSPARSRRSWLWSG